MYKKKLTEDMFNDPNSNLLDIFKELTTEEIKELYEIDCDIEEDLINIRKNRDMQYHDLSKIFGEKSVADSSKDITVDTVALIGNLNSDNDLPTYNIRYIYGNLTVSENVKKLENLEKVFGILSVDNLNEINELDNISTIKSLKVLSDISNYDFNNLLYLKSLALKVDGNISNCRFPNSLEKIMLLLRNKIIDSCIFEEGITTIEIPSTFSNSLSFIGEYKCQLSNVKFPQTLKYLDISGVENMENTILPYNLKSLIIDKNAQQIIDSYKLPETIEKLDIICQYRFDNRNIITIDNYKFNDGIKELSIENAKINKVVFPPNLVNLSLNSVVGFKKTRLPLNLKHLNIDTKQLVLDTVQMIINEIPPNLNTLYIHTINFFRIKFKNNIKNIEINAQHIVNVKFPKEAENITLSCMEASYLSFPKKMNVLDSDMRKTDNLILPEEVDKVVLKNLESAYRLELPKRANYIDIHALKEFSYVKIPEELLNNPELVLLLNDSVELDGNNLTSKSKKVRI